MTEYQLIRLLASAILWLCQGKTEKAREIASRVRECAVLDENFGADDKAGRSMQNVKRRREAFEEAEEWE